MKMKLLSACIFMIATQATATELKNKELVEPQQEIKQEEQLFEKKEISAIGVKDGDARSVLRQEDTILELENNVLQKQIIKIEKQMVLKEKEEILKTVPAAYLNKPEEYFKKVAEEKRKQEEMSLKVLQPSAPEPVSYQIDLFMGLSKEQEKNKVNKPERKIDKDPVEILPDGFNPTAIQPILPAGENVQAFDISALKEQERKRMEKIFKNSKEDKNKKVNAPIRLDTPKKEKPKTVSNLPELFLESSFMFGQTKTISFSAIYSMDGKKIKERFDNIKIGEIVKIGKTEYSIISVIGDTIKIKKK